MRIHTYSVSPNTSLIEQHGSALAFIRCLSKDWAMMSQDDHSDCVWLSEMPKEVYYNGYFRLGLGNL